MCVHMSDQPSNEIQSSNVQDQESLDERMKNLLKQEELVTQKRELAEKLQPHVKVPERR